MKYLNKHKIKKNIVFAILICFQISSYSQAIYEEEKYVPETNPLVVKKIEQWQDIKFGLLMHWGAYSQWAIDASWTICPEEYSWCQRTKGTNPNDYISYKKEYEELKKTFNPLKFNPEKWAEAAKNAGIKYVVFPAKHHDGFCMYDSKYTDYKITSPESPFSTNPRSNILKEVLNAFRGKDLWAGIYFSKPDWHTPYYWDPKYPPRDRNVNYDPEANPKRWNQFIQFTHNQIMELLTNYGKIDILWLDGGWVAKTPKSTITNWYDEQLKHNDNGYLKHRIVNQDILMDELVQKARQKQPELIVVDRAVYGKNQNYLTPENRVPEKALPHPWESCLIAGKGWEHREDPSHISAREGIQLLVDIVAKGGNLLLNIAPTPEGEWPKEAYALLKEFGIWMKINGEGIYNSKVFPPYKTGNICMTQQENGNVYLFYMCKEKETLMPSEIIIDSYQPKKGSQVTLLGHKKALKWNKTEKGFRVMIPKTIQKKSPCNYVWTLRVSEPNK